jgi:putative flippase GtrA
VAAAATTGVRRLVGTTGRLILKELSAFGIVGIACFLLDIALFQLLYDVLGVGAVTSKFVATVLSMTAAYFAHRHWSFSHRARTDPRREYLLFAGINSSTLLLGLAVVAFVRYPLGIEGALQLQLVNIGSIVLSTALRYLAYRQWVFPAHQEPVGEPEADDARLVA